MSKALKKLREERKPIGLAEFERGIIVQKEVVEKMVEAEKARREEERAKRELEKATSEISKRSIKLLKKMLKDEEEAPETYRELAKALETLDEPVRANTLRRIAMEEEMHYAHIRDIVTSLEKEYEHRK